MPALKILLFFRRHDRIFRALLLSLLVIVMLTITVTSAWHIVRDEAGSLECRFLDVGQGDSVLLRHAEKTVLVDTGPAASGEVLCAELSRLGVVRIDLLVLTHAHEDHTGNARLLIDRLEIGCLMIASSDTSEACFTYALDAASEKDIPVRTVAAGVEVRFGNLILNVLAAGGNGLNVKENQNLSSIVLRVALYDTVLLLTGDGDAALEERLLEQYDRETLDCDLLKVAHHGSNNASSAQFLEATSPAIAVITCGKGNSFGFPHDRVLADLASCGATVYRTDLEGTLCFIIDREGIHLEERG